MRDWKMTTKGTKKVCLDEGDMTRSSREAGAEPQYRRRGAGQGASTDISWLFSIEARHDRSDDREVHDEGESIRRMRK
jgi:hypothetical protein